MRTHLELISTDVLTTHDKLHRQLRRLNHSLALSSGWHYPLDWIWVLAQVGALGGRVVLDAGAGVGLLQWYLAAQGARVISVDRSDRRCIPPHLLQRFNVSGFRAEDAPLGTAELLGIRHRPASPRKRLAALARGLVGEVRCRRHRIGTASGRVTLLSQDLAWLSALPDESIDLVVSISALEHNETPAAIAAIFAELKRVLKPGGQILITVSASRDQDWFFAPAHAWILTEMTLRRIFEVDGAFSSNFAIYDHALQGIRDSAELRRGLSARYLLSRRSGMPWGRWDPRYVPVGVSFTKA